MGALEGAIIGGLAGMLIAGIISLSSYSKFKSLLKRCRANDNTQYSFTYKGKKYDFAAYVEERAIMLKKIGKRDLQKMLSKESKKLNGSKNAEFEKAEIAAIEKAISFFQ